MRGGASTAIGSGVRASHPSGLGRECGRAAGVRQTFYCLALPLTAFGLALGCAAPGSGALKKHYPQEEFVSIYVVEHGLVDMSVNASKPLQLTDEGLRHKDAVTAAIEHCPADRRVRLTHTKITANRRRCCRSAFRCCGATSHTRQAPEWANSHR